MRKLSHLAGLASLLAVSAVTSAAAADRPAAGAPAPAFSLAASTGKTVSLAEYQGKRVVVLAFFPKAFTGG